MEIDITIFDAMTGAIQYVNTIPEGLAPEQVVGDLCYIKGRYQNDTHYIDLETNYPMEKYEILYELSAESVVADGETELVISGLPNPTKVQIGAAVETVTDGTLELVFDSPGEYEVSMRPTAPQYLETRVTVEATEET